MNNLEKAKTLREKYLEDCQLLITDEVKKIMRIHKNLVDYSDCMGLRVFHDKKDKPIFLTEEKGMNSSWDMKYGDTYKTFSVLNDMYDELLDGGSLGITIER